MRNWAGNIEYQARYVHEPTSVEDVRKIVSKAGSIRTLGSRHSFNAIADAAELISLHRLSRDIDIDPDGITAWVPAQISYGDLAHALVAADLALPAMASLPHISVGGAIATATHGSGDAVGNLATQVNGLELVTSEGDIVTFTDVDVDFSGMPVHLGALGVVTRIRLRLEPTFTICQSVFEHLGWDALSANFDTLFKSAYGVSLFTDYGDTVNEVWLQERLSADAEPTRLLLNATPAATKLHPVKALSPKNCTEQLGIPGLWCDRLPHFRRDMPPASGNEVQSEYFVSRAHAIDVCAAMRMIQPQIKRALMISEIRSIAADTLWMSPACDQDVIGIHCTWQPDMELVMDAVPRVERALAPFDPLPHWGKVSISSGEPAWNIPHLDAFRRLAHTLDYRGAFRNDWFARNIG